MAHRIVTLPGDGIGPEIMAPTLEVLRAIGDFEFEEHAVRRRLDRCARTRADRRGARGLRGAPTRSCSPRSAGRSGTPPTRRRRARSRGCSACARGSASTPTCARCGRCARSTTPRRCARADRGRRPAGRARAHRRHLLRREDAHATGASDVCVYTVEEIERIARRAFALARAKVSSVDKANVLETSRLWREVVARVHATRVPARRSSSTCSSTTPRCSSISSPRHFDVILTENMFGDILSDEAAMLTGSIGMLPERLARRRRSGSPASSSPSTAPRRTSPAGVSPIRWRCSSRRR